MCIRDRSKAEGLTIEVFEILRQLMGVMKKYYPSYYCKYLEAVFYNPEVWVSASKLLYSKVMELIQEASLRDNALVKKSPYYLGILLSFIEAYSSREAMLKDQLDLIMRAINLAFHGRITKKSLSLLFSYANALHLKDRKEQFVQISHILSIFVTPVSYTHLTLPTICSV
eukprot:TRINITY_DN19893_c0_g1_i1.p1 TRINITY_DN19893_c0_g1~~TRINITY_DN19893_c0_g1_i1.p1  ORF type:complete len:170 (-),score=46.13 TRINITY_DN19893_c0_g1_i1:41-550(-)